MRMFLLQVKQLSDFDPETLNWVEIYQKPLVVQELKKPSKKMQKQWAEALNVDQQQQQHADSSRANGANEENENTEIDASAADSADSDLLEGAAYLLEDAEEHGEVDFAADGDSTDGQNKGCIMGSNDNEEETLLKAAVAVMGKVPKHEDDDQDAETAMWIADQEGCLDGVEEEEMRLLRQAANSSKRESGTGTGTGGQVSTLFTETEELADEIKSDQNLLPEEAAIEAALNHHTVMGLVTPKKSDEPDIGGHLAYQGMCALFLFVMFVRLMCFELFCNCFVALDVVI